MSRNTTLSRTQKDVFYQEAFCFFSFHTEAKSPGNRFNLTQMVPYVVSVNNDFAFVDYFITGSMTDSTGVTKTEMYLGLIFFRKKMEIGFLSAIMAPSCLQINNHNGLSCYIRNHSKSISISK